MAKVETMLDAKLVVGMMANAYQNLNAIREWGHINNSTFSLFVNPKETDGQVCIANWMMNGELYKSGKGPTFHVALCRLFEDTAKMKPEMFAEKPWVPAEERK